MEDKKHPYLYLILTLAFIILTGDLLWWHGVRTGFDIEDYTILFSNSSARERDEHDRSVIRGEVGSFGVLNIEKEFTDIDREIKALK